MWISSSAFEDVLSCTTCIDPGTFGRRADPWGDYVRSYIPELAKYPVEFIYEPWTAPLEVQETAGCVIGKEYPNRIVIHEDVSVKNAHKMSRIKKKLQEELSQASVDHPSLLKNCTLFKKSYCVFLPPGTCSCEAI